MSQSLNERYFNWLIQETKLIEAGVPNEEHLKMLHILYTKDFVWFVPNDDNRWADGVELREEFLRKTETFLEPEEGQWMELGCSMLELLLGLSRRFAFMTHRHSPECFWELLGNVGLDDLRDAERINYILDQIIWRTYEDNGKGGLFPLDHSEEDQRKVELWYQLNLYVLERDGP